MNKDIERIKHYRETHEDWLAFLETLPNPEDNPEYKHVGSIADHKECITTYDSVIEKLELFTEIPDTFGWMVDDMKNKFDEQKSCFGEESEGGYSPSLQKAIDFLEKLKG